MAPNKENKKTQKTNKTVSIALTVQEHKEDPLKLSLLPDQVNESDGSTPMNTAQQKKKMFLKNSQVSLDLKSEATPRNKQKKRERRDSVQSVESDQFDTANLNSQSESSGSSSEGEGQISDRNQQTEENEAAANKLPEEQKQQQKQQQQNETLKPLVLKKGESKKSKSKKGRSRLSQVLRLKQKFYYDDYTLKNYVGRNILHRSCLKTNHEMVDDLIKQFKQLKNTQTDQPPDEAGNNNLSPAEMLQNYVNELDKFGNSPLILSCIQETNDESGRKQCLQILLNSGADVNHRNPRTHWSALHWCGYYGNYESVSVLLDHIIPPSVGSLVESSQPQNNKPPSRAYLCFPDYRGLFPLDLAGLSVTFTL